MRLEYDLNAGALYVSLSDHDVARTQVIDDNTCVDLDAGGVVVGIEVIATSAPWPVDRLLRDYQLPPGEAEQLRTYFLVSLPDAIPGTGPLARYEAPTMTVVGAAA